MLFYAGGDHHTIVQDNEFYNIMTAYGILGYDDNRVLVENNSFHDFSSPSKPGSSYAVSPKCSNELWFIRGNRFKNTGAHAIHFQFACDADTRNNEVSYNLVLNGPGGAQDSIPDSPGGVLYIHHNTFVGNVYNSGIDSGVGPFFYYNNVIVNEKSGLPVAGSHIEIKYSDDPSRVHVTDNLVGYPVDNIVDADGNLTPAYSKYLGLRGYQLNLGPAPPDGLRIQ